MQMKNKGQFMKMKLDEKKEVTLRFVKFHVFATFKH